MERRRFAEARARSRARALVAAVARRVELHGAYGRGRWARRLSRRRRRRRRRRGAAVESEDVGRALIGLAFHVVQVSADDGGRARERDRPTELVLRRAVEGRERLRLSPRRAAASEDVGRALRQLYVGARTEVVEARADDRRVAFERYGVAEIGAER